MLQLFLMGKALEKEKIQYKWKKLLADH